MTVLKAMPKKKADAKIMKNSYIEFKTFLTQMEALILL
jgi:hypothetical protein